MTPAEKASAIKTIPAAYRAALLVLADGEIAVTRNADGSLTHVRRVGDRLEFLQVFDADRAAVPTPLPNPGPLPAPVPSRWHLPKFGLPANWLQWVAIAVVAVLALLPHVTPTPNPGPVPPAPTPGPPGPTPTPPTPGPVPDAKTAGHMTMIQVINPDSASPESVSAAAIRRDPKVDAAMRSLNIEWRSWDKDSPGIANLKLTPYLPDPAMLPCLLFYDDKGDFYDLTGKRLGRTGKVAQSFAGTADELIGTVTRVRGK